MADLRGKLKELFDEFVQLRVHGNLAFEAWNRGAYSIVALMLKWMKRHLVVITTTRSNR